MAKKKKKNRDGIWGLVIDKAEEAADVLSDGKLVDSSGDDDRESRRDRRDRGSRRGRDDRDEYDAYDEEIGELRDAVKQLATRIAQLDSDETPSIGGATSGSARAGSALGPGADAAPRKALPAAPQSVDKEVEPRGHPDRTRSPKPSDGSEIDTSAY